MTDHTYRFIHIVGTSSDSSDKAISSGIERAAGTSRDVGWFEVTQVGGMTEAGQVQHFQVGLKVGSRFEEATGRA